jgi:DNA-directed RNA polymerase subunit M/transcription elongation factor TFIIS
MTIWFKACPRCKQGLVVFEKDIYGQHIQCLQCGYMKDVDDENDALAVLAGIERPLDTLPERARPPRSRMVG